VLDGEVLSSRRYPRPAQIFIFQNQLVVLDPEVSPNVERTGLMALTQHLGKNLQVSKKSYKVLPKWLTLVVLIVPVF
jgi:hypothetical protein